MVDSLIDQIKCIIQKNNLIKPHSTVVMGLSGGPDSIFLLHILTHLSNTFQFKLIAAHLDHQWRSNSLEDVLFCQNICQKLNITFICQKASEINITKKYNGSKEELGRILRRTFLESVAEKYNTEAIALAHHQDDQQETFFIRLLRGATITGLSGIELKNGLYIRPLLYIKKADILSYLDKNSIDYVHDYTNDHDVYLRNRIRHSLIDFKNCDDRFDKNFQKTLTHIQQTELFLVELTDSIFKKTVTEVNGTYWLDRQQFLSCHSFLQPRILVKWLCVCKVPFSPSEALFKEIIRFLLRPNSGRHQINTAWYIDKNSTKATIYKN